jgi:hypothetical protein
VPLDQRKPSAQQESTTEIVTEADKPNRAPTTSKRPQLRPQQLAVAQPEPEPKPEPKPAAKPAEKPADKPAPKPAEKPAEDKAAIDKALQEALSGASGTGSDAPKQAPAGPPLTAGEKESLRLAVQSCWVVDPGSPAAHVTITIAFSLDRSGKVLGNTLKLVGSDGGDAGAAQSAFDAARRAVLRCQKEGYTLPVDKFDQWSDIEMTFNPEKMRNL